MTEIMEIWESRPEIHGAILAAGRELAGNHREALELFKTLTPEHKAIVNAYIDTLHEREAQERGVHCV